MPNLSPEDVREALRPLFGRSVKLIPVQGGSESQAWLLVEEGRDVDASFVTGHDFSRAATAASSIWASAPAKAGPCDFAPCVPFVRSLLSRAVLRLPIINRSWRTM